VSGDPACQKVTPNLVAEMCLPRWYAVHTRARHEKIVTTRLQHLGITTFLPTVTQVHRWSDRRKCVETPLLSCYAFVNLPWVPELRAQVIRTDGVLGFVGFCGGPVPVPDAEIQNLRTLVKSMVPYSTCPFLKIGQRVRVRGGALDGMEGILVGRNGNTSLVISIDPIHRSLAIRIDGYSVEPA
jgi:transcription antitermination factor NusG